MYKRFLYNKATNFLFKDSCKIFTFHRIETKNSNNYSFNEDLKVSKNFFEYFILNHLKKGYEFVFEMDCDFSHEPEAIPTFTERIGKYDLVVGSRYIGGIRIMNWPMQRLLLSYFASIYARTITGIPFSDSTGGFNCYSRKALTSINLDKIFSIGYAFQIELKYKIWSLGLPSFENPITFFERTVGNSKMSRKIILEAVVNVFRLRIKKIFGTLH